MSDWIVGYGSLIWRPAFDAEEAVAARLQGWQRRFWQGSPDHRGVPDDPGRVVTVLPDVHAEITVMAYRLHSLTGLIFQAPHPCHRYRYIPF